MNTLSTAEYVDLSTAEYVDLIIAANKQINVFWSNSKGWAPDEAAGLISRSRLDRQVSLSESLKNWIKKDDISDGDLILAWANLGALVEGTMKLFLAVHYEDYKKDADNFTKSGGLIQPDTLMLEKLKNFFIKKEIVTDWHTFIGHVQQRRNAIHAFQEKSIGDYDDLREQIKKYHAFLLDIDTHLPYP